MEKRAQQRIYQINVDAARKVELWARQLELLWEERHGALAALLEEEKRRAWRAFLDDLARARDWLESRAAA